ncbi:MAG: G8 domain-containing protein [Leptolyngbyaceae cyanobacterium]
MQALNSSLSETSSPSGSSGLAKAEPAEASQGPCPVTGGPVCNCHKKEQRKHEESELSNAMTAGSSHSVVGEDQAGHGTGHIGNHHSSGPERPGFDPGSGVDGLSGQPADHFSGHGAPSDPAATTKQGEHQRLFSSVEGHFISNQSRVYRAINSGAWSDPSTWEGGQIPGKDALVYIPSTVDVTYDQKANTRLDLVYVKGGLKFAADVDTQMVVDSIITAGGSNFTIGTKDTPVGADVTTDIVIRADGAPADQRGWDPGQFSKGIVTHGAVDIVGAAKTAKLALAEDAQASDTALVLKGSPDGWSVGDTLVLAGTYTDPKGSDANNTRFHDEELEITSLTANGNGTTTVRFKNLDTGSNALRFDHTRPDGNGFNKSDLNIYVANLSRNITVSSEAGEASMPENGGDVHTRGHVMFMHNPDVQVHNAAFVDLGRTDKAKLADSDENVKGRYSIHAHRTGAEDITQAPAEIVGIVVKGSPGWGITHHQANLNIIDSVVYETVGSGIVAEAGDEVGLWRDNLVMKVTGRAVAAGDSNAGLDFWNPGNPNSNIEIKPNSTLEFDFGRTEAYWVQGAGQIAIEDNAAASAQTAITFFADSWELANKDALTVTVGNLRVRKEDGTIVETEAYSALKAAGYEDDDRIAVGAAPPKGVDGFEASNVGNGAVFWLVQRNPDGDADLNPIFVTNDTDVLAHAARVGINDVTLWGVNQNGILLQDSSAIDFNDVTVIADGAIAREQGAIYALDDVKGVALGEAGSSNITVKGLNAVGFADDQTRLSFGPDFNDKRFVGTDGQDVMEADSGSLSNDYMAGGAGDDFLSAGAGNDVVYGGAGDDVIKGGETQAKRIRATQGSLGVDRDVLIGGQGDDTFLMNGESPWVDRLFGGPGYDTIQIEGGGIYGAAFNRFSAYEQSIEAIGPQQGDPYWKFTGTDTADHLDFNGLVFQALVNFNALGGDDLYRGVEQDEGVYGGEGNDWISGMGGNDHLIGEAGNDTLRGDAGRNWLEGNQGQDTFQAGNEGVQILRDFDPKADQIEIAAPGVNGLGDLKVTTITWNPSAKPKNDYASGRSNEKALYITWGNHTAPADGAFVKPYDLTGTGIVVRGVSDFAAIRDRITILEELPVPTMDFTHPVTTPDLPDDIDPADLAPGLDPRRLVDDTSGPQTAADLGLTDTTGYYVVRPKDHETIRTASLHTSLDTTSSKKSGGKPIYGIGNDANNMIYGLDNQNDILIGGGGNDVLQLETGFDIAIGGPGDDMIRVGARLNASSYEAADVDMPDQIYGGSGYDLLVQQRTLGLQNFSRQQNSIEEIHSTRIVGANGPEGDQNVLDFRGVALKPQKGRGVDAQVSIDGRTGNDTVYGNNANNTILGGDGNDFIAGEGGRDVLQGGTGADTLRGGSGKNQLTGGAGADVFEVGANEQTTIQDFTPGSDRIRTTSPIANVQRLVQPGKTKKAPDIVSTEVTLANGSTIRLERLTPSQFDTADVEVVAKLDDPIAAPAFEEPTPAPEPTPVPEPEPVPAPTPDPEPAPEPDPQPQPEPDPMPMPEPTPAPPPRSDPKPGPVPQPTPSPDPTPIPDPEPSPDPAPSVPQPEPTPEPAPQPQPAPTPDQPLLRLALVDAATDQVVKGYEDLGATSAIDLNSLDLTQFSLAAQINPKHSAASSVKSVRFESSLGSRTENVAPYALFGDNKGDFRGKALTLGNYRIKATAFTARGGKGDAIATSNIQYTVTADPVSASADDLTNPTESVNGLPQAEAAVNTSPVMAPEAAATSELGVSDTPLIGSTSLAEQTESELFADMPLAATGANPLGINPAPDTAVV